MAELYNPITQSGNSQTKENRIKRFTHWLWYASPQSPKHDLNLLDNVEIFLNSAEASDELTLEVCKRFIKLHRITENTSARKRLEKWARRTIQWYLIIVGCIIVSQGLSFIKLSDTILITILSTTTVNILGLGFIVLRGHFQTNQEDIHDNDNPLSQDTK